MTPEIEAAWKAKIAGLKEQPLDEPLEDALDDIATLCGCPEWDYAAQLVRDVALLAAYFEVTSGLPIADLYKESSARNPETK